MKYVQLVKAIDAATQQLLGRAATVVNQALVIRNWLVGAYIVEFEQRGQDRASYGERLMPKLASDLEQRGVRGMSLSNLKSFRQLFQVYPQIGQTLSGLSGAPPRTQKSQTLSGLLAAFTGPKIQQTASIELQCIAASQMNYYVNYFKRRVMADGDNPPVGIILCSDRDQTKVEFATAGMDNKLFVSRYLVNLPSAEQLSRFVENDRARIEAALSTRPGLRPIARIAKTRRKTSRPKTLLL